MNLSRLFLKVKCPKKNLLLCLEEESYSLDAVACHFLHIIIFFYTVFILCKCKYKSWVQVAGNSFLKKNDINAILQKVFFSCLSSQSTWWNNIFKAQKAFININNSKKSTKNCNSTQFHILQNVLRNVLFLHKFFSRKYFILPKVFDTK